MSRTRFASAWTRTLLHGGDGHEGACRRFPVKDQAGDPDRRCLAYVVGHRGAGWAWGAGVMMGYSPTREAAKTAADCALHMQGVRTVDVPGGCVVEG